MNTRSEDFSKWYQRVIQEADLSENSPVRGCMTIKPYGFAIWENLKQELDMRIKQNGVQNCYFPLLIPTSFFAKEAEHVEGFAKEVAVVTHYRLKNSEGKLIPDENSKLEEPYVIRPTSETIIGEAMSRWVQSHRDLPLKLNQWANVMRWEMRTRPFLRTSEFLWQEGHNAFASKEEAKEDAEKMLKIYQEFARDFLAMYSIGGLKTSEEKFCGAEDTYTFEAMMQDGKALQTGTSHDLGDNFAKAFDINYQNKDGQRVPCFTTSWGVSTRLIGGLIMSHSDDDGLILPPNIAPIQVVILPFIKKGQDESALLDKCQEIKNKLIAKGIRVEVDDDADKRFGDKTWGWIKKGVPYRVEIGSRELEQNMLTHVRRDLGKASKQTVAIDEFVSNIGPMLQDMQSALYEKHKEFTEKNTVSVDKLSQCRDLLSKEFNGFIELPIAETETESFTELSQEYKVSRRCRPFIKNTNKVSDKVIIAKSY